MLRVQPAAIVTCVARNCVASQGAGPHRYTAVNRTRHSRAMAANNIGKGPGGLRWEEMWAAGLQPGQVYSPPPFPDSARHIASSILSYSVSVVC